MPRIEMAGLSKRFASGRAALDGIDLEIAEGEFLAVVGPSGSGKSTLLRLVAGLETPDGGSLTLGGRDSGSLGPQDRDAALVFQNQAPLPHLNGRENLAFGARARHVASAEIDERIRGISGFLGLDDCLDRMPATMSGGEKQRMALGRALVRRPSLLLLDEPFSNLDAPLRVFLRAKLAEAHRTFGTTTVLVTHDQEDAMAMGDRVAVLNAGRIEQVGAGRDLYDRPANRFVAEFLGNPPMATATATVEFRDGRPWIQFASGSALPVDPPASADLLRRFGDGPIVLGLRPEHLLAAPDSSPGLVMRVLSIEDRGPDRIARVGRPGLEFRVRLPPDDFPRLGDDLRVQLDLDRASWFDPNTGVRLA